MAGERILLLEDDEDVADLLMHVLLEGDYVVDLARNVAEARRLLLDPVAPRLFITDWRLPDGDGITIADTAADLGIKTAILTGYALQVSPEEAERHEVWLKPMRPVELLTAVQRCIGSAVACN